MPSAMRLESLNALHDLTPKYNDVKDLKAVVLDVFRDLQDSLGTLFGSLESKLLAVTKIQDEKIEQLRLQNDILKKKTM